MHAIIYMGTCFFSPLNIVTRIFIITRRNKEKKNGSFSFEIMLGKEVSYSLV